MSWSRRDFLRGTALLAFPVLGKSGTQDSAARHPVPIPGKGGARDTTPRQGGVAPDPLYDPSVTGRLVDSTGKWDNDAGIIAIERRLRCRCGCTLDVYTCRTTDFTCTYSPAMHREVIALVEAKKTPEEVIQAFIASDGEKVLMAPVASGFNIAGYVVPGLAMVAVGLGLAAYLSRRREVAMVTVPVTPGVTPTGTVDDAAREKLKRALDEVES